MGHAGQDRENSAYGEPLYGVHHPPFSLQELLGLMLLIAFFSFGIHMERNNPNRFDFWFGIIIVSIMTVCLVLYCLRTRRGCSLIIFQNGIWFWLPARIGTFYSWREIKSIRLRKSRDRAGPYFALVITVFNPRQYWSTLSLKHKVFGLYYIFRWKSPLYLKMPCKSFSDIEELYAEVQSRLDDARSP